MTLQPDLLRAQDTTPPDTTITSGTIRRGGQYQRLVQLHQHRSGFQRFTAQMDGGGYVSVTSPKGYSGLSQGVHTFSSAGDWILQNNTDPTPASRTFTVDTIPPDTTITSGPSGVTANNNPSFSFISTEAGSTYEVQMDGGGYTSASSPKKLQRSC
ncbi:MAG: hypothetical protein WDN00_15140 [Limisphaerales bacterium]